MITNTKKKVVAMLLALLFASVLLLPVLTACNNGTQEDSYTYNEYISQFPSTWNTHNGTTDADTYIQGYTEIGLYDFTLSEDRTTYAFVDEMATGDPINVTSQYASDTKWNITADQVADTTRGRAWQINLNPDATWENGTKITADDYVWSMERVLSPDMKNSAASAYTTGDYAIYNASNYYNAGSAGNYVLFDEALSDEEITQRIAERSLYFSLTDGLPIKGVLSLKAYHDLFAGNANNFREDKNPNNRDWLVYLDEQYGASANEFGYILVTEDNLSDIRQGMSILAENLGADFLADWTLTLSYLETTHPVYTLIPTDTTYTDAELEEMISEGTLYFSLTTSTPLPGTEGNQSLQSFHDLFAGNARFFRENMSDDPNDRDWFAYLNEQYGGDADEYGYIQITDENYADIKEGMSILSENLESLSSGYLPNWYNTASILTHEENASVEFENVGIFKTSDTSFVLIFENPLTQWQVKYMLTDNWIVYRPYYEEGYSQQGALTVTNYGTTSGKYMGYGPYKLTNYQVDREIRFERNTSWYGYNSESTNYHEGQFQTDYIVCQVIENQATALLEFESDNLDSVRLTANDMNTYRFSDYLLTRSASNNWTITFNSDETALGNIENTANDGANRRILSVTEFRKAISLSLDRAYIGRNILAGSAAAYSFINNNYYYDMENDPNSIYRNSEQAMQAIVRLYGIEYGADKTYKTLEEAYRAVSGYDIDQAKANFQAAYTKAIADDLYTDGQNIQVNIYNNALSSQLTALETYMQNQVDLATEGTPLEDKITITFCERQSGRYADIANGNIEAVYYSYSGDYNDPNGMLGNYTDPTVTQYILEYGFDPTEAKFSITCDFDGDGPEQEQTIEKTYQEWYQSTTAGKEYASAPTDVKLTIMAELEYQLLSSFRSMPLVVGTDLTLRSKKVNYATNTSNIFAMYGGVRLMTYNYNDAEWAEFCRTSSNLDYR